MFTIQQIQTAHAKVKSGADFPSYIQEMKRIGVVTYEHFVTDGGIKYYGTNDFIISADARWVPREVAEVGVKAKLKHSLSIHQKGETDYPTFCKQAAQAGVEIWTVDLIKMICTYFDKSGNQMVIETVPAP